MGILSLSRYILRLDKDNIIAYNVRIQVHDVPKSEKAASVVTTDRPKCSQEFNRYEHGNGSRADAPGQHSTNRPETDCDGALSQAARGA